MPKVFNQKQPPSDFKIWPQEKQMVFLQEASLSFLKDLLKDLEAKEFVVVAQQMKEVIEQVNMGKQGIASAPTGRFQINLVIQLTQIGFEAFKKTKEDDRKDNTSDKSSVILLP